MSPAQMMCVLMCVGLLCLGEGISKLTAAATDTRGQSLELFSRAVQQWNNGGKQAFMNVGFSANLNGNSPMSSRTVPVTAMTFGETSWSSDKVSTPATVEDVVFSAVVTPAMGADRQFLSVSAGGALVHSEPLVQTAQGATHSSALCQYYDGDFFHPMTTMGMGACNSQMAGASQTYNYGPQACVDDRWADANGCPNDMITTTTMQTFFGGYDWYGRATSFQQAFATQQKRFTYGTTEAGKPACWDFTDCFCEGYNNAGTRMVWKTDTTKGYVMSGYGYLYNGHWTRFPRALHTLSPDEKAGVCYDIMSRMSWYVGVRRHNVKLTCFRAGGFPKQKCSTWCPAGGYSATGIANWQGMGMPYSNGGQNYQTASFYNQYGGQYGGRSLRGAGDEGRKLSMSWAPDVYGQYPTCTYEERINRVALKTSAAGVLANKMIETHKVGGANLRNPTPITVEVSSTDGPVAQGEHITGCKTPVPSDEACFGPTQLQNAVTGIFLILLGLALCACPLCCMLGPMRFMK